jgi:arylsulfatase A-like enzyme
MRLIVALVLATCCVACRPTPKAEDLNVVFIILDAAGARHFGCYGNDRPTTPRIDAFARTATLFERAYSQAAWTLPSVGSFMTGRYPPATTQQTRISESETLATSLRRSQLHTAGFSENSFVTAQFGLAGGFEVFKEYFPHAEILRSPRQFQRRDSRRTVDDAISWLDEHRAERFFLYVHFLMPHAPYDPPPPFGGAFDKDYAGSVQGLPETLLEINEGTLAIDARDLEHLRLQYEENLAYADHQTGRLLDALATRGLVDRTLIIIAADHGEAFREHGEMLHNTSVYDEMIHVPLIMRLPPVYETFPSRYAGVVELRAIYPTICEVLHLETCPAKLTTSLLAHLHNTENRTGLARAWATGKDGARAALILQRHKLIADAQTFAPVALFDLEHDPGEVSNVAATNEAMINEAMPLLRNQDLDVFASEAVQIDAATRERLKALGYGE